MRLFNIEVLDGSVSGLNAKVYSSSEFNGTLGAAEKYFVQAIVTQVSGTGPKIQIDLETSSDGNNWTVKSSPVSVTSVSSQTVNVVTGTDTGTTIGGAFVRAAV